MDSLKIKVNVRGGHIIQILDFILFFALLKIDIRIISFHLKKLSHPQIEKKRLIYCNS